MTNLSRSDFGQPLRILSRNDSAKSDDDLVTEYQYAAPGTASPIFRLAASEAKRALLPDGITSGEFLAYSEELYDGLPFGQSAAGNLTRHGQYDGPAPVASKPGNLRAATRSDYGNNLCPGRPTTVTDAAGFSTRTIYDDTCTFTVLTENASGHRSSAQYYGIHNPATPMPLIVGAYGQFRFNGRYGQVAQAIDPNRARTLTTYDEWGRTLAVWSPLDRNDRPGVRYEYADAMCEKGVFGPDGRETFVPESCEKPVLFSLRTPARTTTFSWDDQIRRCQANNAQFVPCASPAANKVASEPGTGAYVVTHTFGDGQIQAQTVNGGTPDWTLAGTSDFDRLGRKIREYKIRYLPRQATPAADACPEPGQWCDSARLNGDPIRRNVASVQLAYDFQNRLLRIYGPGVPRCQADPSDVTAAGDLACDAVIPPRGEVTKFSYPAPGETSTVDANGVPKTVRQDTRGLVTEYREFLTTSPQPYSTLETTFDRLGRAESVRDQAGNVSRNSYDALSRILSSDDPDLGLTTFTYDARSQLIERLIASGEKTRHTYDELGRVTQTDYLRPRSVPTTPVCCTTTNQPARVFPPDTCTTLSLAAPPPRFTHGAPSPLPLSSPVPLQITQGIARTPLPFNLNLGPVPLSGNRKPTGYRFVKGTQLSVSTAGRITLRGSAIGPAPNPTTPVDLTLDVFSAGFTLDRGGLRTLTEDVPGARTLIVEWQGRLPRGENARVLVRAIFSEIAPALRYEYLHVPPDPGAEIGIHLKMGTAAAFDLSLTKPAGGLKPPQVADGSVFWFDDQTISGLELGCSRGKGGIEIPMDLSRATGDTLRVRYRGFSECDPMAVGGCGAAALTLSYRLPVSNETYPLARSVYTVRPSNRPRNAVDDNADNLDIPMPPELRNQRFGLFVEHSGKDAPFALDIAGIDVGTVIYEPEERVYRSYDSSEPAWFLQSKAGGGFTEIRPIFDLSFDVDGRAADRSPTAAAVACTGLVDGVAGASGRGLLLSPNAQCSSNDLASNLTAATLEFWLQPRGRQQDQTVVTLGSTLADFSVGVLTDGRVWCGPPAARVTSRQAIPTDAWSHVGIVYDGTNLKCLINGEPQGSVVVPRRRFPVTVGRTLVLSGGTAGATFDEVRMIATARSDAEILEDALRPLAPGPPRGNLLHLAFGLPSNYGTDTSKASNNATLSGGAIVPGILGMAFDTQTGGRLTVPHSATLQLADVLTAEVWMKMRNTRTTPSRLIGKWQGNAAPGWRLDVQANSGRLLWEVVTEFTRPLGPPQTQHAVFVTYEQISDNNWHHVAGTYDGHRLRVFIDGIPAHRWCSPVETPETGSVCLDPPDPTACTIEARTWELPPGAKALGDAVCVQGSVNNTVPVLIASDAAGADFDGWVDEARLSNYAKREFEVAASARLASAFTQSIGRETTLRNQLPVGDDLAWQVAREHRAFDVEGNAASWFKRVRGQKATGDFVARAATDSLARVGTLEYPHAEVVANGSSLGGVQDSVIGYGPDAGAGPGQSKTYVRNATATVTGKLASMLYGNGVSSAWTYDDALTAAGGFGPETLKTSKITVPSTPQNPTGALSDRLYQWDAVRDLATVTDTAPSASYAATYTHDDLRRVSQASFSISGNSSSFAYSYDPLGNLRTKEDATQDFGRATLTSACTGNASAIPHALTRRTVGTAIDSYCYDASGRLVRSPDTPNNSIRNYYYYARGKVSHLSDRNGESVYTYDGNGLRVWKAEPVGSQTVPFGFYRELPNGREATYSIGGRLVARRVLSTSPDLVWFSTDHLDGTNFLTNESGVEVPSTRAFYRPFGEFANARPQIEKSGNREFTSKELDASGLYDFNARLYDPATGGFTQADEAKAGSSPQALNSFSYVLNSPLRMIDPTGHQATYSQFVRDPVAGTNEVALIQSNVEEWLPYLPSFGNSPANINDLSNIPTVTARGNIISPISTAGRYKEYLDEMSATGVENPQLALQQYGMETLIAKNNPGLAATAVALNVLQPVSELAAASTLESAAGVVAATSSRAPGPTLNLGGTGEVTGAINLNVAKVTGKPLIIGDMAQMPIRPASMGAVVGRHMPFQEGGWAANVANESFRVLEPGGVVKLHSSSAGPFGWLPYLRSAGFSDVRVVGQYATGIKP